jgi:hypothetical protein
MASNMTEAQAVQWSTFTTDSNLTLDSFIVFKDVDKTHSDMIDRYYILKNKSFTTEAEKDEMTQLAVDLIEYLPTSDTWNKLCACVMTMEMYMRDGIVVFVEQKQKEINEIIANYSEKGTWDAVTNYKTGNFVKHGEYLFLSKVDNNLNHEPNNEVLSDDYWMRFLIKGDKGDPSLNISIKTNSTGGAEWDNVTVYNVGDACVYNHRLYYCLVDGTVGIIVTDTTKWACADNFWIGIDEPLDHSVIWWDINVGQNVLKRYSDNNEWVEETIKASNVTLVDNGNYFTINTTEGALQELGLKQSYFTEVSGKLYYKGNKVGATTASEISLSVSGLPTNVNDGMSTLFQYANNGKTSIANVVGTVTGSNTFSEMANEIQVDKNILANNLTNKGVSANGTSNLKSLVNSVANITVQSMGGIIPLIDSFNNYVAGRTFYVNYNTFYNSAYNVYFIRGAYADLSMFFVFNNGKMLHRKFTSTTSQLITPSSPAIELKTNSSADATVIPWNYIGFNIDQSFFPLS